MVLLVSYPIVDVACGLRILELEADDGRWLEFSADTMAGLGPIVNQFRTF